MSASALAEPGPALAGYDADTRELLEIVITTLEDTKAQDLVILDVRKVAGSMFDAMVICTATSARHGSAMADRVRRALKNGGHGLAGHEGPGELGWELLDAGRVLVHIMRDEAREHYDLEGLWTVEGTG